MEVDVVSELIDILAYLDERKQRMPGIYIAMAISYLEKAELEGQGLSETSNLPEEEKLGRNYRCPFCHLPS